jgi:adhesin transport system outer membrane protein
MHIRLLYLFVFLTFAGTLAQAEESGRELWTLDAMLVEAVRNHPSVQSRSASLASAQSQLSAARQQFLPTPTIAGEQAVSGERSNGEDRGFTFGLQQPIWTGGRYTAGVDLAKAQASGAEASLEEMRYNVALATISAWTSLTAARDRNAAYRRGLARLEAMEQSMRRRIQQGASAAADLDMVTARVVQARSVVVQSEAEMSSAAAQLSQITGIVVGAGDLDPDASSELDPGLNEASLIEQCLATYPSLKRMKSEFLSAEARTSQVRAGGLPTMYLKAQHETGVPDGYGQSHTDTRVVVAMEFSLGAGWSLISQISAASKTEDAVRDQYRAERRDLTARVVSDFEMWRAARAQEKDLTANLQHLTSVSESYERMFLAGRRGWLDVLNAVREGTEAERARSDMRAQAVALAFRLKLYEGAFPWITQNEAR